MKRGDEIELWRRRVWLTVPSSLPMDCRKKQSHEDKEWKSAVAKYARGEAPHTKHMADKKLKSKLKESEKLLEEAATTAARAERWLLPAEAGTLEAEGIEQTFQFQQRDIVKQVDARSASKAFDLRLDEQGPYNVDYSINGRYLLLGGSRGHLAHMDWQKGKVFTEVQLKEDTHAVKFLHNDNFFAVAQRKYVYIYDKRGIEIHRLKDATRPRRLEFLPHHFLLCSVGDTGVLHYQDTSTGEIIAQHRTRMGPVDCMRQNPYNAIINLGHKNGVVSMWSPNLTTPLVKLLAHRGPVTSCAVDALGRYLVTSGADGQVRVWDVRTFKPLHSYFSRHPAATVDISQRGLLAVGAGRSIQVWKDALSTKQKSPYMAHRIFGRETREVRFCPYEDVLAAGHDAGVTSILVPGAGEPNFDSFVANPYQTKKQKQEAEVQQLLDKPSPSSIVMDPDQIGRVNKEPTEIQKEKVLAAEEASRVAKRKQTEKNERKSKMKGKNRASKRYRKKQSNVIDDKRDKLARKLREQGQKRTEAMRKAREAALSDVPRALQRFVK